VADGLIPQLVVFDDFGDVYTWATPRSTSELVLAEGLGAESPLCPNAATAPRRAEAHRVARIASRRVVAVLPPGTDEAAVRRRARTVQLVRPAKGVPVSDFLAAVLPGITFTTQPVGGAQVAVLLQCETLRALVGFGAASSALTLVRRWVDPGAGGSNVLIRHEPPSDPVFYPQQAFRDDRGRRFTVSLSADPRGANGLVHGVSASRRGVVRSNPALVESNGTVSWIACRGVRAEIGSVSGALTKSELVTLANQITFALSSGVLSTVDWLRYVQGSPACTQR
jgi:hypothetical protein